MGRSLEIVFFFLHFFLGVVFSELEANQYECSESRCRHDGPAIRFPFRLKGLQPDYCGYPRFDLYCNEKNQTVMELPSSAKLLVKNINYKYQQLHLCDQHNCLARQLPYLNLSLSPFQFKYSADPNYLTYYTFVNCSSTHDEFQGLFAPVPVPCLDVPGYHVYAVYPDLFFLTTPLLSCSKISTDFDVPYNILDPQVLYLKWTTPLSGNWEAKGMKCRLKKNNSKEPEIECFRRPAKGATTTTRAVVASVISGFCLLVLISIALYKGYNSHKVEKEYQDKIETFLDNYKAFKPTRYSYADIKRITNQFKDKLGEGGYGTVFKGKLSNEILVAVKILNNFMGKGEEFINEVGTMGMIHHVNVVRLVGFCADGIKRALVYEFLPNESLEKFIFSADDKKDFLGWEKLQDIAIGVAKGIEYLHQGCDQRILHFDIKPHNILLDKNFNPRISDFGLAKLCSKDQSAVSMTAARGTMGYIAPEVLSRNFGNVSYKSDVYSFGMLLLEMVGGRKNIDVTVQNTSQAYFPEWVYNCLDQGEELRIRIKEEGDAKIAKKLTIVGLWCIQWNPVNRPSMKIAVQILEGNGDNLTMPPNPFASTSQMNSTTTMHGRPFSRELAVIFESD